MVFTRRHWLGGAACVALACCLASQGFAKDVVAKNQVRQGIATGGVVEFQFDASMLDALGWSLDVRSTFGQQANTHRAMLEIADTSSLAISGVTGLGMDILEAQLDTRGALLFSDAMRRIPIGNLSIRADRDGAWRIVDTLPGPDQHQVVFELSAVSVDFAGAPNLRILGEVALSASWAEQLGIGHAAGMIIGAFSMDVTLTDASPTDVQSTPRDNTGGIAGGGIGPDVIVGGLPSVGRWARVGDIIPYSVGTTSCNIGTARLNWFSNDNRHPVIGQNMFRYKDGRFEQIGMSWLKHGFFALSGSLCTPCNDPTGGSQLGVGCSDPYGAGLNGSQGNLGPLSQVNASSGDYPYPWSAPPATTAIHRRLQVHVDDLNPTLNPGAQYFVEGHYIASDDAAAGNNHNNASYRSVNVAPEGNTYAVTTTGPTERGSPGIRAWKDLDNSVDMQDVFVPDNGGEPDGLIILGAQATDIGGGMWHYEYAVHNLNSHRSVGSVTIMIAAGALVQNIGFHDVDQHSGEPYDTTDWVGIYDNDRITWSTEPYAQNEDANAIRWSTLYNFRFDANIVPAEGPMTLGLFRPGTPDSMEVFTVVPTPGPGDCNDNGIIDNCEVNCGPSGGECDIPGCGIAPDCNSNELPDECEPDCNNNGEPDECDITNGLEDDCDGNIVPDICDPDFDGDSTPDACDDDIDNDGLTNEADACDFSPTYIPIDAEGYSIADFDNNCILDLTDYRAFDNCISTSGPAGPSGFAWCQATFDVDQDSDVDIKDFSYIQRAFGAGTQ